MIEIESIRSALAPRSDLHPADWCAEHVYLEGSELSQKFDPAQFRWWRKPMGMMADYVTKEIVCIVPPGFGKSSFYEALSCWIVAVRPGPTLYLSQTNPFAEQWLETRAMKAMRKCEPLRQLWPINERNAFRKDTMVWPHMFMNARGANVSATQEVSIQYGLGDEVWQWGKAIVGYFLKRSHNRENRKFVLCSQAGTIANDEGIGETSELHMEHDKCRQWDFAWKCPKCGSVHPFRFEQLKFDEVKRGDDTRDDQASAETVRRICPNTECAAEFSDTPAARRMLHDSYQENDGYLLTKDEGLRGYEGFHVDYGANWRIPWASDILQKMAADRQMAIGDHTLLKQWHQQNRAVGWCESQSVPAITIGHSGYTESDYEQIRRIDNETYRFCTIDAGGDHFWVAVRAWANGGDSRLLYFAYVPTEDAIEKIRIQYGVEPHFTFLDFGWESERMAAIAIKYGWQGIKGDGNRKSGWEWEIKAGPNSGQKEMRLYNRPHFEKAKNGGRAKAWTIATEPLQYILQRLIHGEGASWQRHDDAPPSYLKHLNGERLLTELDSRGRPVPKWTRVGANHGRDCEIYQLAAALMFRAFIASPPPPAENP